jgi:hypothetical protein
MMPMTRTNESTASAPTPSITLLLAFELGERVWKLGFTTGLGQRARIRQVSAGAVDRVLEEIARAKRRWKVPPVKNHPRAVDRGTASPTDEVGEATDGACDDACLGCYDARRPGRRS